MFRSAFDLFVLRELPWSRFNFPRWQALTGLVMVGVFSGFDPGMRALFQDRVSMPAMALGLAVAYSLFLVLVSIPVIVGFLRWWMQRGGRWDGQGEMLNLFVASCLVANMLSAGLNAVGMPMLLMAPLWLYSAWVSGHALSGAIPQASLGYSLGGIVVTLVLTMIVAALIMGLANLALAAMPVPLAG